MTREMKNSELIFASKIPYFWEVRKMKDISNVITDYVASGSFKDLADNVKYLDSPDYAMLIRTADLSKKTNANERPVYIDKHSYDFLHNSNLYGGEIILPNVGTIGEAYIVENLYPKMSLAPNSIMLKTNYCDKYYYYYFNCDVGSLSLKSISEDAVQSKFNKTNFKLLKVIVPPLLDQQAIANFLDDKCSKIDETISRQKAIVEKLKEYRQSTITEAVTKGLNPDVKMKECGLEWIGKLPDNWYLSRAKFTFGYGDDGIKVGPFGSSLKGKTVSKQNGKYKVYNQANLIENDFSLERHYVSEDTYKTLMSYEIKPDDILFSVMGTIGKCKQMPHGYPKGIMDSHLIKTRLNNKVIPSFFEYVYDKDNTNVVYNQLLFMSQGSIMDGLNSATIKNLVIPIPPIKEQQQIVSYLDNKCFQIDEAITRSSSIIEKLEEYKKTVIYEYVTGKKEVPSKYREVKAS